MSKENENKRYSRSTLSKISIIHCKIKEGKEVWFVSIKNKSAIYKSSTTYRYKSELINEYSAL